MLEWVVSSTLLILAVVALRAVSKGRISFRMRYALWLLVLLRLLIPVNFGAAEWSAGNLTRRAAETEGVKLIAEAAQTTLPRRTYSAAYTEVAEEYAEKGVDISVLPVEEFEAVDYEILARMDGEWTVRKILTAVWLLGAAAVGVILLAANIGFAVKLRRTRRALEAPASALPVYLSSAAETPCLFGLFGPAVYVTPEAAADDAALRHVVAHERTHFRHGDHIWSLLRGACLALHWYNPAVWWAASLSQRDAELACDEAAIERLGEDERAAYGRTLLRMTCEKHQNILRLATTMTGSKNVIRERIMSIAKKPKPAFLAVAAVLLLGALAAGCTFTGAAGEDEPPPVPEAGSEDVVSDGNGQEAQGADSQGVQGTTVRIPSGLTPEQKARQIIDDIPGVLLSEEEIARFNDMFVPFVEIDTDRGFIPHTTPVSCFFTSFYDDVTELDFLNFLWYHPTDGSLGEEDAAEFETLSRNPDFYFKRTDKETLTVGDLPVPTHRILRSSVDETLQTYAGVTTADLKSTENVLYLPEYDAYYVFTSDFGPGAFQCEGGKRDGGTVRLWTGTYGYDGSRLILTLREADGNFYIKAHQNTTCGDP